jgi:SAM-dependent methyltransferase
MQATMRTQLQKAKRFLFHLSYLARAFARGSALARCPYCGLSVFVRFREDSGLQCIICYAGIVQGSLGWALHDLIGSLGSDDVCELSARGALANFLRRTARSVAASEYHEGVQPGSVHEGIRCEDVQRLTYADASFDLVTHTEVLEHVPDDRLAFKELLRVLRPGGTMVFTIPMHGGLSTVERARIRDGAVDHLLEPVYHLDSLRGEGILAFRDYGDDVLERLQRAGFVDARIVRLRNRAPWGELRPVIFACRPASPC